MSSTIGEMEGRKLSTTLNLLGRYAEDMGLVRYDADDPRIAAAIEYVCGVARHGLDRDVTHRFLETLRDQKTRSTGEPYTIPEFVTLIRVTVDEGYMMAGLSQIRQHEQGVIKSLAGGAGRCLVVYCKNFNDLDEGTRLEFKSRITTAIGDMAKRGLRYHEIRDEIINYLGEDTAKVNSAILESLVREGINQQIDTDFRERRVMQTATAKT